MRGRPRILPKYLSRQSGRVGLLVVSAIAIAMLVVSLTSSSARLVWNFTPSIPTGLYTIEDRYWVTGDRVALRPTGKLREILQAYGVLKDGRLLMKRIAAASGDTVCRLGLDVSVNGTTLAFASADEKLPNWSGCFRLNPDEILLLGETSNSFDGRYFGLTSASEVVGPLHAVITF